MRRSIILGLCALSLACTPPPMPIDAGPAPNDAGRSSRLYFVSDLFVPLPDPLTGAYASDPGLDLDDIVSEGDGSAGCDTVADATDPTDPSRRGIDNELSLVVGGETSLIPERPPQPTSVSPELIAMGDLRLAFRIVQSGAVTSIEWGTARPSGCSAGCGPQLDGEGVALTGQSMTFTPSGPIATLAATPDGRIGAALGDFTVPFGALYAPGLLSLVPVSIVGARIETTAIAGPLVHGVLGGALTEQSAIDAYTQAHPFGPADYRSLIASTWDGDLEPSADGQCTAISVGLDFTAVLVTEVTE